MSILRMENLETNYERFTVFKDLNLEIKEGLVTTIIGPNGCGKSRLLKTIGRILKQKSGSVYLQGQELHKIHTKQIAKHLALLPQNPVAPAQLKVEELISYGRYPHRNNVKKRLNGPWISQKPFHFETGRSQTFPVVKDKKFG
ncbi:ABC transporter ATP-binding protein [Streptomyces sp. ISL-14]|nr:ABC transporter ATP-binding protein [Streptomyces sp. ISL-14]